MWPIREVRVYSRRRQRSEELCERLPASHPGVDFVVAETCRQAVRGADVICAATRSQAPLFETGGLAPTAHINAIGAYRLDMHEVPPEAFRLAATVAIDQLAAVLAEAGDVVAALDGGFLRRANLAEIGQLLISGTAPASGLTIFKSVGIAGQDWPACELAVRRAWEAGLLPGGPQDGGAA